MRTTSPASLLLQGVLLVRWQIASSMFSLNVAPTGYLSHLTHFTWALLPHV